MSRNKFVFDEYFNKLAQRIDWLVTACSGSMLAREQAKEHLNTTIKEILTEVYDAGFVAGEKEAGFYYDQRFRVMKFKTKEKTAKELRKEILDQVLKEYGLKDGKIKKKLVKRIDEDETELEETD
jgi:hypothetical protein